MYTRLLRFKEAPCRILSVNKYLRSKLILSSRISHLTRERSHKFFSRVSFERREKASRGILESRKNILEFLNSIIRFNSVKICYKNLLWQRKSFLKTNQKFSQFSSKIFSINYWLKNFEFLRRPTEIELDYLHFDHHEIPAKHQQISRDQKAQPNFSLSKVPTPIEPERKSFPNFLF